jgi:hypothetical protein
MEIKTTAYFREQVLRKRPYLRLEWCYEIIRAPLASERQLDGRMRFWGTVQDMPGRVLRIVTLAGGETIHNAFPDRNFRLPSLKQE